MTFHVKLIAKADAAYVMRCKTFWFVTVPFTKEYFYMNRDKELISSGNPVWTPLPENFNGLLPRKKITIMSLVGFISNVKK